MGQIQRPAIPSPPKQSRHIHAHRVGRVAAPRPTSELWRERGGVIHGGLMGVIHGSPNGFDICDLTNVI